MAGFDDNPVLSRQDYQHTMARLNNQFDLLSEGVPQQNYAQGLLNTLNPTVNPGGSSGLIGGLEHLINKK